MKFQPGQSGNPAGRPPGSLNKKTLAVQAALEARAEEVVDAVVEHAKNGKGAAMRLCMDRFNPTGRNRPLAIDLPVVKTADDAEAALAVVHAHLAAGDLTVDEASALMLLIERMVRLADRIEKMRQAERERQEAEALAQSVAAVEAALASDAAVPAAAVAAKPAEGSGERLYFPVNQADGGATDGAGARADGRPQPSDRQARPQAKAA
jgi:uncharacterized protein DUF5681